MAETKGITIDFYGNTVEFDRSIDGVNKALKNVKSELNTLNKQLKLDPNNVDLLSRKFDKLKEAQRVTTEQVKLYSDRLAELSSKGEVGTAEWDSLTKKIQKAQVELDRLNKDLASMPNAKVQEIAGQFEEMGNKLNKVGGAIESAGKALMPLSVATGGLIASGLQYNATLEQQTSLFRTLTGSAEEAERVLALIRENAKSSIFDTTSLITANQYLMSAGVEADSSMKAINDLSNAIAATGGGNAELQRMAQNLQQIANNGKANTMDMRQFANAGINLYQLMADSTGKTVEELQELDITYDMITEALAYASGEQGRYFGAMEGQAETINGQINKLKATFSELLGSLTESLLPTVNKIISTVQKWVDKFNSLDKKQKELITRFGLIVAAAGPVLTIIGKLIGQNGIGGFALKISDFLKSEGLVSWLAKVSSAGGGLSGVLSTLMSTFTSLLNPINLVIGALVLAYAKNENFRKTVNNLVSNLLDKLKPAFDKIKEAIDIVVGAFGEVIDIIADLVGDLGTSLGPAIDIAIDILGDLFSIVGDVAKIFAEVLAGAIEVVVGWIQDVSDWFNNLFETLKNTSFGQAFIDTMDLIVQTIQTAIGWVKDIIGWFQKGVEWGKELLGIQSATNNASNTYSQQSELPNRPSHFTGDDRYAYDSGGIGIVTNIHINNNGQAIDESTVNGWVETITDKLDIALGRRV